MGRNKNLKRKIAAWRDLIATHKAKIQIELKHIRPDWRLILHWQKEITSWQLQIAKAELRLKIR
jgi:hypothetical protein